MNGEIFHLDRERKRFETTDTAEVDRLTELAVCPECTFGYSGLKFVMQRARALHIFRIELRERAILLTLKPQPLGRDLAQMNFHTRMLSLFTWASSSFLIVSTSF